VCVDVGIQSESREQRGNGEGEERETERQSDYFLVWQAKAEKMQGVVLRRKVEKYDG
jgi:hypothetical protein